MSNQKIVFVTGKGGVGKSTVALALAGNKARNKKVLLVELGNRSYFGDALNLPVNYNPIEISSNLYIARWSGRECLTEYARHLLKIDSLYQLFFENKMSRALIDVAPGLAELSILGKITSGIRSVGPPLNFDQIIVDGFATGHMMALLRAPRGMAESIKFGPMAEQSESMIDLLRNGNVCEFNVVALPEELPVIEADDLARDILIETGLHSKIIVNRVWPMTRIESFAIPNDTPDHAEERLFLNHLKDLARRQKAWIQYLEHRHSTLVQLPQLFNLNPRELDHQLKEHL